MAMEEEVSLTKQLQRFSGGEREIAEAVLRATLPELHRIAVRQLQKERYIAPLQATELINEAWMRGLGAGGWRINDRKHFYVIAALAMRRVLVDYARQRRAQRRGGGDILESLDENLHRDRSGSFDSESIVAIGLLMEQLEEQDPEASSVVDMHYFTGYTLEEIAEKTGWSLRQVRGRWKKGLKWLKDRM
jgi:RNA polymerase sigma factor (TIGR02999 family)